MEDDLPKSLTDLLIDMIMKFLTAILTTAILAFAAGLFLPWWSVAIAAFVVALVMKQSSWKSALAGFLGGLLLWGGLAAYISLSNEHILAKRVSLLILKVENPWMLVLASGLVGALVSGLAALAGSFLVASTAAPVADEATEQQDLEPTSATTDDEPR